MIVCFMIFLVTFWWKLFSPVGYHESSIIGNNLFVIASLQEILQESSDPFFFFFFEWNT